MTTQLNEESAQISQLKPTKIDSLFTVLAFGTLLIDAYLVLASVATKMMKAAYVSSLPPFGAANNSDGFRTSVLVIATWTAVLAVGCLRRERKATGTSHSAGAIWFVLVLAVTWCVSLIPKVLGVLSGLFL